MLRSPISRARAARRTRGLARRATLCLVALSMCVGLIGTNAGCFTQRVPVNGGVAESGAQTSEFNQWFVLWGLVPLTKINPENAAPADGPYNVVSTFTPLDCVINFFTSIVTVYRKSIVVEQ